MTTTQTSSMTTGMSNHCKSFIVKAIYKHYYMNIFWREVCQKASVLLLFITSVVPFSDPCDIRIETIVVCITGVISLLITFFCDATAFHKSYHVVLDAYKTDYNSPDFNDKYNDLLEHIRDIDIARGKKDFEEYCKINNTSPTGDDKLTQNDKNEMNRQRYIIIVLSFIAIMGCLLPMLITTTSIVLNIILGTIIAIITISVLFMLFDCDFEPFKKH